MPYDATKCDVILSHISECHCSFSGLNGDPYFRPPGPGTNLTDTPNHITYNPHPPTDPFTTTKSY